MTKFIKGDRVKRQDDTRGFCGVEPGGEYTVATCGDRHLRLEGSSALFVVDKFDLVHRPAKRNPDATTEGYKPNIGHTKDGGGLQQHSVGGPYPFVLVGIDNPAGLKPGLYWFVQDKTGRRVTAHRRSCDHTGNVAASLSQLYPDGICPDPTPDLSLSEGYIKPLPKLVTLEITRAAAEVLQLMCAHTAGPLPRRILPLLSEALGYDYDETKERHDVSFLANGPNFESGWHKGRSTCGALAITPKGAV